MATAGLLVLADQWAAGRSAKVDGQPAELLRVNHALKGVALAAGTHTIVFEYQPPGLVMGPLCCGLALTALVAHWFLLARRGA
ncbi:MAG: YfhO family protein [Gemmataceae bacterium]